jgi:CHAT domain-containing protein
MRYKIAALQLARGELARALAAYRQTLDDLRTAPDPLIEAAALIDLGRVYRRRGDRDEAEKAWSRAETICSGGDNGVCLTDLALVRGDAQLDDGKPTDAAKSYQLALDLARRRQLRREEAAALRGLGLAATGPKPWEEARARLEAAQKGFHEIEEPADEAATWIGLGDLASRQQMLVTARRDYAQALELARAAGAQDIRAIALAGLARSARQYGESGEARRYIEQAIEAIEARPAQPRDPALHSSYFASARSCYELYIDILMQLERNRPGRGYAAAALTVAERARARTRQEQLAAADIDLASKLDPALLDEEHQAEDRVRIAAAAVRQLASSPAPADRARALAGLDDTNRRLDTVRGRIRAADPRYAEWMYPAVLTGAEIQHTLLDPDWVLLEYWLGDAHSYLWVASQKTLRGYVLPARSVIEPLADQLLQKLAAVPAAANGDAPTEAVAKQQAGRRSEARDGTPAAVRNLAGQLGAMLLQPLASLPADVNTAIVGDGILQRVPYAWLVPGNNAGAPAFGASRDIVALPSVATLRGLRRASPHDAERVRAAVLADPVLRADDARLADVSSVSKVVVTVAPNEPLLRAAEDVGADLQRRPDAREEAEAIAAIASNEPWIALDFDASREAVLKTRWDDYAIAHFATPALLDARHPELSGIVLSLYDAHGNPQDGFLRLGDLYRLQMPVDLVVLSACETVQGKDAGGSAPPSLADAFFHAGARRLIASLWTVDGHASAQLMRDFYAALIGQKLSPPAALRRAQTQMVRDPRWQAPHYWAGFVLQGDWRWRQPDENQARR